MTAFPEFAYVLLACLLSPIPASRRQVYRGARRLAELERRRLARYLGEQSKPAGDRALTYLALRCVVGGLGAGIFLLIVIGLASGAVVTWQMLHGTAPGGGSPLTWYDPFVYLLGGALLAFLAVQGLVGVASLDRVLAGRFLGPSRAELLLRRVSQLATTRAQVVEAVDGERRRIERDLHDGVQQRLVALGMLLGRARRTDDATRSAELLRQAHEESQNVLRDLREVTWRMYPIALDDGGLGAALDSLAERSQVPIRVDCVLTGRPDPAIETAAYFVASEAVNNAIKHAGSSLIEVNVAQGAERLRVRVRDDGCGGADVFGGGLSGLARRVAAVDGQFRVHSPSGGPTLVMAELPCRSDRGRNDTHAEPPAPEQPGTPTTQRTAERRFGKGGTDDGRSAGDPRRGLDAAAGGADPAADRGGARGGGRGR
ncbi:sensor histidine kinase [Amycolatopsis antarctica]|uniref:sensor histidine kinase n=1 Tax=Amycolatopsis antarctica TaxID=1854586 RepID=UPI0030B82FF2